MEPGYLMVVVTGIGGTELAVPGDRARRIWTVGFGNIAGLIVSLTSQTASSTGPMTTYFSAAWS
jgi:hypothetical protein